MAMPEAADGPLLACGAQSWRHGVAEPILTFYLKDNLTEVRTNFGCSSWFHFWGSVRQRKKESLLSSFPMHYVI